MNILTGYLSSTEGTVEIAGVNILDDPNEAKKHIGYLPEQPPLYLDMTVEEYLNFVFELKSCKLNRKEHIAEICEVVKIKDVYKRLIKNLSKGYRQRVGIAQALIGNPEIIIFDEPTVGLDPKQIVEIRSLIRSLGEDHVVILSTHILPEVQAVCDRIVMINRGKIVANEQTEEIARLTDSVRRLAVNVCGPTKEVKNALEKVAGVTRVEVMSEHEIDEGTTFYVEGMRGIDVRKPLFFAMAAKSYPIISMENIGATLEDVFIALVDKPAEEDKKKRSAKQKPQKLDLSSISAEEKEAGAEEEK
jgi:ABC-2 type transport system ATP-binding protein